MSALSPVSAPGSTRAAADLDRLQGSWVTAAGSREARLLVAGNRFALELGDGDVYIGSFSLDPGDEPRRMDMRIEEGPPHHRGLTAYCIYEFDGGVLRWCPSRPGSASRLVRFPAVDDRHYLSLVFRRAHPRRVG